MDEKNTLDILLVLRVLRIIKIMGSIERFKVVITTIMNIGPSIVTYGGVVFVFYYTYAIVGMELFSGVIRYYGYGPDVNQSDLFCGNAALNGSTFFYNRYCSNNFNDILKSLVLLFELMYVNQWHALTNGFVLVTSKWARLYFISFHMLCVLLVLNIFVAFVLEAFILEYNLSAGKIETALEMKIKEMGLDAKQKKDNGKLNKKMDKRDLVSNMEGDVDVAAESQRSDEGAVPATPQTPKSRDSLFGLLMSSIFHVSPVTSPAASNSRPDDPDHEAAKVAAAAAPIDHDQNANIPSFLKQEGIKFHLKKNKRKKVLVLLETMFENEIDPEDIGPENEDDIEQCSLPNPSNLKLDGIA